jgi:hypothetical protein
MRTRSKLILAAISAIALLGMAVSAASASRLEVVNSERGFRIVWSPLTFEAAEATVRCNVTLEGSFTRRTTTKTLNATIGTVTRAPVNTCTGGTASSSGLPWTTTYGGFGGTLPAITSVTLRLTNARFTVQPEGLPACNATTETEEPARGIATVNAAGEITAFRADETATIGTEGGFLCFFAGRGRFIGPGTPSVLGETAKTRLRLI